MLNATAFQSALPGLVLVVAAAAAHAHAAQDFQDTTLAPTAQRAARTEALERARLLMERAGTFREGERLAPDADPRLRAEARRSQGDLEGALPNVMEAERLVPGDGDGDVGPVTLRSTALNYLVWSLHTAGKHEKALPILAEILAENPEPTGGDAYHYIFGLGCARHGGRRRGG